MRKLTFWYDFASTYSYLSAMQIEAECKTAGVEMVWQPFLLGPIFKNHGWNTSPFNVYPAKGKYMHRDMARLTEKLGLPAYVVPETFPQHSVLAARVGLIAQGAAWEGEFSRAVFRRQFEDGADISAPEAIAEILESVGQPGREIVVRASTDQAVKDALRTTTQSAADAGIFGAPTFVVDDGEMFWGHDRLADAIAWTTRGD